MLATLYSMVTKITRPRGVFLVAFIGIALALMVALYTLQSSSNPSGTPEDPNQEQGVENVIGTWGNKDSGGPYLQFNDDGSLMGNDGCNGFSGRYTVSDDGRTIVLNDLLGTLKGCPGVDTWLREARSAVVDGDTLTLFDETEEIIGSLDRD